MRRIALFSDVHANLPALSAVIADIGANEVPEVYCLGDLVGYGPWPAETIGVVRDAGIPTVRGNYDDGVGNRHGHCGCYYATEQAKADGEESYAFTDAALGDTDHAWLASLPDDIRLEEQGARILLAHGSPRKINEYLLLDRTDEQLARLADQAGADVVCVGHVHVPYHRTVTASDCGTVHYVSSGSVGKPKDGDPRAGWVEVLLGTEAEIKDAAPDDPAAGRAGLTDAWVGTRMHRCEYDVESVASALATVGLPTAFAEALRSG